MAFPSSPINGQTATVDGITYTYASATNSWKRQSFLVTDLVDTSATANTVYTQGVDVTQNTRISSTDNTATAAYAKANAAFDKANTGVSTSTDDYARTTANTATNNITILQGVNTTQNTNITYSTNLAQAAYNQANTGGLVSNTGVITVDTFVGNGSNVAFTLSVTPVTKNYTFITFDGATQLKDSYSLSGNIITFTEAPLNGENIEVVSFTNGVITSFDTVARDIANTATNNITILQGVDTTQNTRITSADNTATAAYAKANAAFDKANTGVSTSTDDYARTAANTATNNIVILQGVNTTQNTNIAYATSLAQAAIDASANTGNYSIEYLVVAGGGGGGATGSGNNGAGGGGAGGLLTDSVTLSSGETYVITVGSGGNGGASGAPNNGNRGANSSLIGTTTTITAFGGGYGNASNDIGGPGGSGGGSKNGNAGGLGTAGQGNNGGVGSASGNAGGGGGGGAGAVGGNGSASVGGAGGVGLPSSITGSAIYYAGGGGGGTYTGNSPGAGGNGGGGAGAQDTSATSGTTNTGGGGGGTGGNSPGAGGNGGSGVVILRTIALADSTTGSPTVTYDGAFNIYKFTSSGSIVFPSFAAEVVDITARADVVTLQSVNTTQNTRMSVIEGGLITANANSAYLTSVNTTQNTNITFVTGLAQAAFDKANTGSSGGSNVTIVTSDSFVGNGSTVAYNLSVTPSSKDYTIITFDGAVQLRSSYSLAANTITFTEAPLNGENVEVTSFSSMAATTTVTINTFTGDGSTVAYTLSVSPSSKDYTFVNFDGTAQLRSSYSLSGNILTFTEAPLVGENIEVTSFTTNSTSSGTTIGKAIAMSIIFGG